ncbi:hypothetical protein ASF53_19485 [Methylobacterium sp. Leaf123]|nr:hypothetical protein ASF53_19485 [Methylobacterium sp. Leaf123]
MNLPWAQNGPQSGYFDAEGHGDRHGEVQAIADKVIRAALAAPRADSAERTAGLWRCPECDCHSYARVDQKQPGGGYAPGPLIRCVNCKDVFDTRATPAPAATPGVPDSVRALSEAATQGEATYEIVPFHLGDTGDTDLPGYLRLGGVQIAEVHEKYGPGVDPRYEADGKFVAAAINFGRALIAAQPAGQAGDAGEAERYAESLAVALWQKHWRENAPDWKPLTGDLIGILTQIDNMTCGLSRAPNSTRTGAAEIADGAYGSNPMTRGAARDRLSTLNAMVDRKLERYRANKPAPDSTRTGAAEIDRAIVSALNAVDIVEEAESYEFRPDVGCHTPNEFEKVLLIDFAQGLMNAVHQAVRPLCLAARPEAPSDAGWRDISTAPKDGTEIWAWLYDSGVRKLRWWSAEEIHEEEGRDSPDAYQAGFYEVADRTEWWNPRWWVPADCLPTPPSDPAPSGQAEG